MDSVPADNQPHKPKGFSERIRHVFATYARVVSLLCVFCAAALIGGIMSVFPAVILGYVVVLVVYIPLVLATIYLLKLPEWAPLSKGAPALLMWLLITGL